MKNILIVTKLFILIPIALLLLAAFLLCGEVSLLKFLFCDIIFMIFISFLYNKLYDNKKD